ncbi:hypothetical protein AWM75_03835 [Aerococcus urinaehominis]|uniref:Uncharacterized protein n=1 Tax=Aerococcus urinaehominis TaxID=128944 RepID=A0A109RGT3_9LACT|nr:hypothetical protein AWM75_03835 [Aerococcus urinaehominis]
MPPFFGIAKRIDDEFSLIFIFLMTKMDMPHDAMSHFKIAIDWIKIISSNVGIKIVKGGMRHGYDIVWHSNYVTS